MRWSLFARTVEEDHVESPRFLRAAAGSCIDIWIDGFDGSEEEGEGGVVGEGEEVSIVNVRVGIVFGCICVKVGYCARTVLIIAMNCSFGGLEDA